MKIVIAAMTLAVSASVFAGDDVTFVEANAAILQGDVIAPEYVLPSINHVTQIGNVTTVTMNDRVFVVKDSAFTVAQVSNRPDFLNLSKYQKRDFNSPAVNGNIFALLFK